MYKISFRTAFIILIVCIAAFAAYIGIAHVVDANEKPEIACDTDMIQISIHDDKNVLLQGITASDAEDGDLSDKIIIENISTFYDIGKFRVTYAVCDSDNNVAKCERSVQYTDYVSPTFTLSQQLVFNYGYQFDLRDYINVNDCIDGNISSRIKTILVGNASSIYNVGVWTVRAEVTNSMGDTSSVNLDVTVQNIDPTVPVIKLSEYMVYLEKNDTFNAAKYVTSIIIGDTTITDPDALALIKVVTDLDTDVAGEYTVTYTYYGTDKTKIGTTQMKVVVGDPNENAEVTTFNEYALDTVFPEETTQQP